MNFRLETIEGSEGPECRESSVESYAMKINVSSVIFCCVFFGHTNVREACRCLTQGQCHESSSLLPRKEEEPRETSDAAGDLVYTMFLGLRESQTADA